MHWAISESEPSHSTPKYDMSALENSDTGDENENDLLPKTFSTNPPIESFMPDEKLSFISFEMFWNVWLISSMILDESFDNFSGIEVHPNIKIKDAIRKYFFMILFFALNDYKYFLCLKKKDL